VESVAAVQAVGMEGHPGREQSRGGLGPHVAGRRVSILIGGGIGLLGAGAVGLLLVLVSSDPIYAPLLGAVSIAVWLSGASGAVASIVTGWGVAAVAFTDPRFSPQIGSRDERVRWGASLAIGILIAAVGYGMRRSQEHAAIAAEGEERTRLGVERLQALAASLSAALTVEEVAGVMVEGVPNAIGATGGALGLVEGDDLVIVDPRGAHGLTLPPGMRLPLSTRAPITTAAREGKPSWAQRRPELGLRFPDAIELAPYAAGALGIPVFVGERLAGSMGFPFVEPDAITAEVRSVARIAADLGGQALERAGLYELERSSREALDRILAVAPRFQQDASPEVVVVSICAEARRAFGCDIVQIWALADENELEVTWRDPPSDVIPAGTRIPWDDFPGLLDEMRAFRSMFVPNAQRSTQGEALRHATRLGLFTSLRIPIVVGGKFERILALQWERIVPEPAPSVMAVMRRFADQAGLAIEQSVRRRAQEETRALQAVTEALAAAATPTDVGFAVVREGLRAVGARAVGVYATSEDGRSLELVATEGFTREDMRGWYRVPLDAPAPITDAVRTGEMVVCATRDEIAARYPMAERAEESFVAAPLVAGGRVIGGVFISSDRPGHFTGNLSLIVGLARQAAQALDRAQLFERERASAGRLLKLQAVTAGLSQAVTLQDVSRTCLDHAVAGVGASKGIVVLRTPGVSADPTPLAVTASVGLGDAEGQIPPDAAEPLADAIRTGRPASSDQGWVALPLASGVLALHRPGGRALLDADREWLVTLVSQGAQALDRAGRYETERAIAETMQRSVLPERLPAVPELMLAARYLPGTIGVDVGGDWYDVIQLEGGRIGIVVGDVVGKGVQAAAMMAQLRNALRAFAFEHSDPREVVMRLDRLVEATMEGVFATLAYLVVDPQERRVRYVVAGHPPPLVRAADGTTSFLEHGRSLPIGVDAALPFEPGEADLEEGCTIVLYTDGLVERHGTPLDVGLARLAEAAAAGDDDPERLLDGVLEALIGDGERPDDIAVLAVRFVASVIDELRLVLPATEDGLVVMRNSLRAWLAEGRIGPEETSEALLAVWEAAANAVEHAQAPLEESFRLAARLDDGGRMRIEVRDSGRWKPGEGSEERGLGLGLMRSLMDNVQVCRRDGGTEVVLERRVHLPERV
jgi:GAF domain-containing protein/anti-sigma regulatory factor (Ser/Thr protein kinase)